jgi:cytochrome c553
MSFRTVALSLVLSAFSLPGFGQTPEPALDSMAQRVQPCTACHGEEGRATPEGYFPRIAGKPAEYLFNQLTGFRDGRRFFPIMTFFVERQGDEYLRAMSEYFANIKLPYAPPVRASANESTLARGRQLVFDGDAGKNIPSCRSCHGEQLMGVLPATPALLGLSPDYLLGQLGAWQNGTRRALEPDCMAHIARALTSADNHAVTAWLSSQEVPADAGPEEGFRTPPPVECGSITRAEQR